VVDWRVAFGKGGQMTSERHTVEHDLHEALGGTGCALCALLARSVRRAIDALTYEGVTDVDVRAEIRAARGLCATHGVALRQARQAFGAALAYRAVLGEVLRDLEALPTAPPRGLRRIWRGARRTPLAGRRACPVCDHIGEMQRIYCEGLIQTLQRPGGREQLAASPGLCLPHLRASLASTSDAATIATLRSAHLARYAVLAAELDEFIRKRDYRFAREASGSERDSWVRAIETLSGAPGLHPAATIDLSPGGSS